MNLNAFSLNSTDFMFFYRNLFNFNVFLRNLLNFRAFAMQSIDFEGSLYRGRFEGGVCSGRCLAGVWPLRPDLGALWSLTLM